MKKILLISLLLGSLTAGAQVLKYSNAFLGMGVGARALGMGSAVVAGPGDVFSSYWNPAALLDITDNLQIGLMHNEQFAGIAKHDFGAVSFGISDKSRAALSFIRMGIDGIPNTLYLMQDGQINYNLIKEFSAVDYAFIGSYATKTKWDNLDLGGNVKVIRRVIGDFGGSWGFGIDAAAIYKSGRYRFAAQAFDITGTFNAWTYKLTEADKQQLLSTGNELPKGGLEVTAPRIALGVSAFYSVWGDRISIRPELNADFTTDGQRNVLVSSSLFNLDPRLGLELGYKNFLFLRGGVNRFQRIKDFDGSESLTAMPSVGAGVKFNRFAVDYALGNAFNQGFISMSNIISVKLSINRK